MPASISPTVPHQQLDSIHFDVGAYVSTLLIYIMQVGTPSLMEPCRHLFGHLGRLTTYVPFVTHICFLASPSYGEVASLYDSTTDPPLVIVSCVLPRHCLIVPRLSSSCSVIFFSTATVFSVLFRYALDSLPTLLVVCGGALMGLGHVFLTHTAYHPLPMAISGWTSRISLYLLRSAAMLPLVHALATV